jgi:hypothetical protein
MVASAPVTIASDDTLVTAVKTAVEVMDDWDETNRCAVNVISGQVGIAAGAGVVGATVPRVTLASNDPGVALLTTIDADTSKIPSLGNAAMAGSAPVTIASDDTLTTAVKTAVEVMDDWDETDRAKVNVIVGQAGIAAGAGAVGATVPRVTLASDDPGVALLTTIDADTGALATALAPTPKFAKADVVAAGSTDIVAAVPAKKIRVVALNVTGDTAAATTWKFQSNAATDITGLNSIAQNGSFANASRLGLFETVSGEKLTVVAGAGDDIHATITYIEV